MGNLDAALEELEPSRDRNLSADTLRHWVIAAFRAYDGGQKKSDKERYEFFLELFRRYAPQDIIDTFGEEAVNEMAEMMRGAREYAEQQKQGKRRVCVDYGNPGGDPEAKVTVDLHADGLIEVVDIEQFEPKPEYKLEAGCTVANRSDPQFGEWTVLFVIDTPDSCVVGTDSRKLVFCSDGEKRAASNLRVTAPATPEVGDYVEYRSGEYRTSAVIRGHAKDDLWWVGTHSKNGTLRWRREYFTIIAKAK